MLITFSGAKNSGKTTCTEYLVNKYGFVTVAFADPLKLALKELFMFTDDQLYGSLEQKESADYRWFGASPRQIMQFVGTDLFRNQMNLIMPGMDKNFFIHRFKLWYELELKANPNLKLIVSDSRFVNEADAIVGLGGIVVKLIRCEDGTVIDQHQSETECKQIDGQIVIMNDSTIDELYNKLDQAMCLI